MLGQKITEIKAVAATGCLVGSIGRSKLRGMLKYCSAARQKKLEVHWFYAQKHFKYLQKSYNPDVKTSAVIKLTVFQLAVKTCYEIFNPLLS